MSFPARELHFTWVTWQGYYCCRRATFVVDYYYRYSDFFTYQYRSALPTKDKTLPLKTGGIILVKSGMELIDRKIPISAINARLLLLFWYRRRHRPFRRIPRNTIRVSISNPNSYLRLSCPAQRVRLLDGFPYHTISNSFDSHID